MKTTYHKADSRGHANHGWLESYHTFSFANYRNIKRMNFGVLRVLNDDSVSGGMGFGKHPHNDMEIISIPLSGTLKHNDSMGTESIIKKGDVQVMSAGTGVTHSEKNASQNDSVAFLQIWIMPRQMGLEPRYGQINMNDGAKPNDFQQIVSPNKEDAGTWINQDAWLNIANFDKDTTKEYKVHKNTNGVYVFVIEGKAVINNQILDKRDGFGISETMSFNVKALEKSQILLIEVPMS